MSSKFYSWKRTVFIFYFSLLIVRVFSTTIDEEAAWNTILKFPKSVYDEDNELEKHSKVEGMYCFNGEYGKSYFKIGNEKFAYFKIGIEYPDTSWKDQAKFPTEKNCLYLNEFEPRGNYLLGKSPETDMWHMVEMKASKLYELMIPILLQSPGTYKVKKKLEDIPTTSITKIDLEQDDVVAFFNFEYERDNKKGRFRVFGKTMYDHRYLIKTFEEGEDPEIKAVISFDANDGLSSAKNIFKEKITNHNTIDNLQKTVNDLVKKNAADVEWYQYALIILGIILLILFGIILYLLSTPIVDENTDMDEINTNIYQENEKPTVDQKSTPSFGHAVNHEEYYTPIHVQDEYSVNKQVEESSLKEKETSTTSTETAELNTSSHLEVSTNESRNTENITEENTHSQVSSNENTHTEECSQEHMSSEDSIKEQVEDTTQEKETSTTSNELTIETAEPTTASLLEVSSI